MSVDVEHFSVITAVMDKMATNTTLAMSSSQVLLVNHYIRFKTEVGKICWLNIKKNTCVLLTWEQCAHGERV